MSNVNNRGSDAHKLFLWGLELLHTGNPAQAAVVLEKVRVLEPDKASVLEALGRAYMGYGRHQKALVQFNKIIRRNPTEHFSHYCMALCFRHLGKTAKAASHMRMAAALNQSEEYARVLRNLEMAERRNRKGSGKNGGAKDRADV